MRGNMLATGPHAVAHPLGIFCIRELQGCQTSMQTTLENLCFGLLLFLKTYKALPGTEKWEFRLCATTLWLPSYV